jgi:hypothetical protein
VDYYPHKHTNLSQHLPKEAQELGNAKMHVMELAATMNAEHLHPLHLGLSISLAKGLDT